MPDPGQAHLGCCFIVISWHCDGHQHIILSTVQDKDYNLLSFEEQIKVDLETDIMVGPHGAGQALVSVLPRH